MSPKQAVGYQQVGCKEQVGTWNLSRNFLNVALVRLDILLIEN